MLESRQIKDFAVYIYTYATVHTLCNASALCDYCMLRDTAVCYSCLLLPDAIPYCCLLPYDCMLDWPLLVHGNNRLQSIKFQ